MMYTTSLNFRVVVFRKRSFVWILLVVLSSAFVPAINLAQQPTATSSEADMIETIQRLLQQLGYDPGHVDGIMGRKTRIAIRAFQRDHNLRVDGEAAMALVEALTQATLTQAKRRPDQEQEQQPVQAELTTMSPNELYVRAVGFEAQGEIEQALRYYEYLMETYPDHELAVKAADRVTVLSTSMPQLPAISTGLTATISALKGTVLVNDQEQKEGSILIAGDVIETQAGAEITLTLSDGSMIQLGENTQINIDDLSQTTTGVRVSYVKLLSGWLRAFLSSEHQQEGSSFTVETPNAQLGVKFSEPDIEVSYNPEKVETVGIAHTVELMAKNLLTDEKVLVPVGSTVIIIGTTMKVIAGAAAAGMIAAESMGAETSETEKTGTEMPKTETEATDAGVTKVEVVTGGTGAGMSKGTMIAIGAGAAAAGGVAVLAGGGGDSSPTATSRLTLKIDVWLGSGYYGVGETTLSLDGEIIDRDTNPYGSATTDLSATIDGVQGGWHTLSVTIVRQFASRQEYLVNGMVFDMNSGNYLELEMRSATLAAGESITYRFSTEDLQFW